MNSHAYTPEQLRTHRASLFVFGGTHEDRRGWAEACAEDFLHEGPLGMLQVVAQLPALIARTRGAVFVPDVLSLDWDAQAQLVQCLRSQEERAKWILGLTRPPDRAVQDGGLRPDLWHRLRVAQVDVSNPDVQAFLRQRRSRAATAARPGTPSKAPPRATPKKPPGKGTR